MDKRGQLTLFIIVGIILLFSVAIIVYLREQVLTSGFEADSISSLSTESQPVKIFVDKCLEDVSISGVYFMGTQGGYSDPPSDSLLTETLITPYYYDNGISKVPTMATLENEISTYVERTLPICANRFEVFSQEITEGDVRATTRINENGVLIKAFYPLTIKNAQGKEEKIENFVIELPIRLGHVFDAANKLVERQISNPDMLDMSYILGFDVDVDVLPFTRESTIFSITDTKSIINKVPYQLFFANKYKADATPQLDFIPDFVLKKDVPFEYTVTANDADGDSLDFSDNSNAFDISSNGIISFTPRTIGIIDAVITVSDGEKEDSTAVRFDVK